jgi:hypothetical protein
MQSFSKKIHTKRIGSEDAAKIVENAIKQSQNYPTESQLWRTLRRKISLFTFKNVLKQFKRENKIMYDKDGSIIWTFADSPEILRILKESAPLP